MTQQHKTEYTLPEAPLSINTYLRIPGYDDRVQVTARGHSPEECLDNFVAMTSALRQEATPTAPAPTPPTLATLIACGLEKAFAAGDQAFSERILRAAWLYHAGHVHPTDITGMYLVDSATKPVEYRVELTECRCTCPDWIRHAATGKHRCKHQLAAMLAYRLVPPPEEVPQ